MLLKATVELDWWKLVAVSYINHARCVLLQQEWAMLPLKKDFMKVNLPFGALLLVCKLCLDPHCLLGWEDGEQNNKVRIKPFPVSVISLYLDFGENGRGLLLNGPDCLVIGNVK
nr:hypothetical protein Iba_chr06eCG7830 [Ipomoea batatas]